MPKTCCRRRFCAHRCVLDSVKRGKGEERFFRGMEEDGFCLRRNQNQKPAVNGDGLAKALYDKASGELQLNHGGAGDPLNVRIYEVKPGEEEYDRKVQICSTDGQYSLILKCVAHVDEKVDAQELGSTVSYQNGVTTEKKSVREITTRTITWTVMSVTKGGPVSVKTNSDPAGT